MIRLNEDGEGTSAVTQVSNVDVGKINMFGEKPKDIDDVYNKLFELDDYKNNLKENKDKTQFAGSAGSLAKSLKDMSEDNEFFSEKDRTLFKKLVDTINERFKPDDSITIVKSASGYAIILPVSV